MVGQWFICKSEEERTGPFTSQQLRELAQLGKLLPDDRVWREGLTKSARARKVQGLFGSTLKVESRSPPVIVPPPLPPPLPQSSPSGGSEPAIDTQSQLAQRTLTVPDRLPDSLKGAASSIAANGNAAITPGRFAFIGIATILMCLAYFMNSLFSTVEPRVENDTPSMASSAVKSFSADDPLAVEYHSGMMLGTREGRAIGINLNVVVVKYNEFAENGSASQLAMDRKIDEAIRGHTRSYYKFVEDRDLNAHHQNLFYRFSGWADGFLEGFNDTCTEWHQLKSQLVS